MKYDVNVRNLTEDDIDSLVEIEKLCFSIPWSKSSFKDELKNRLAMYLIAEIDDKVVGYGGIWLIIDEGHVTNIAVHPDFREHGIGDKIVSSIIDECRLKNITSVTLEVRPSNEPARKLYKKHGFLVSGIRPEYYSDNHEDAIIMWKDL